MKPTDESLPTFVNPGAGRRGAAGIRKLERLLMDAAVPADSQPLDPARIASAVERLRGVPGARIAVAGGDGSMAAAGAILAGSSVALLPFPTGTLNHFARRLGYDDLQISVDAVRSGCVEAVAVGIVDDRIFLNTATFGLYSGVVSRRKRLRPFFGKWPAAILGALPALVRTEHIEVVLHVGGEVLRRTTPLLWVGLGWGSFPRVHEAPERRESPDLEIVLIREAGRLDTIKLASRLLRTLPRGTRPVSDPSLEVMHARHLLVHASERVGVTLDGEAFRCEVPLFISVQDEALRVVVPATKKPGSSS